MNEDIFSDLAIEQTCKTQFGVGLDIAEVIVRAVPTGINSHATLFKTTGGQIYLYIAAQSGQVLDDVQKIILRMQCEADIIIPPHGEAEYFERIGREKFKALFPGKHITGDEDLRYYKNLAPYNPALVRISKVRGEVRGFDRETKMWRKVKDYAFSKITTR